MSELSSVEKRRIEKVLSGWPEDMRHCYAVTYWVVLEHVGLARRPGKYFTRNVVTDFCRSPVVLIISLLCSES